MLVNGQAVKEIKYFRFFIKFLIYLIFFFYVLSALLHPKGGLLKLARLNLSDISIPVNFDY